MVNAGKLLGGLMSSQMGKGAGRLGGGAAMGMGLLGVAMAAFEHFSEKNNPGGMSTSQGRPMPPPTGRGGPGAPPPPPRAAPFSPPQMDAKAEEQAVLLIRAMIAAAHSDGVLDAQEREAILGRLEQAGLTEEERGFLTTELLSPASIDDIVKAVDTPELALDVYTAALMAVEVDTEAERAWLDQLSSRLGLSLAEVEQARTVAGMNS